MKILDLPQFERFGQRHLAKVLRHKDRRLDLWDYVHKNKFRNYQNRQSRDVFSNARYIISFIAEREKYARFVGVWEVLGKRKKAKKGFLYRTRELEGFEQFRDRLIVRWGDGARSWAQWLDGKGNKEVWELLPPNSGREFPGYYDFKLTYAELRTIVSNPDANREWHRMLSSISGLYVIVDTKSGKQYIGSAYGKDGIWGRWRQYAKKPSGGNKLIRNLLARYPKRYEHFQFSILRVLEPESTKDQVIAQEVHLKNKLGRRALSLNAN